MAHKAKKCFCHFVKSLALVVPAVVVIQVQGLWPATAAVPSTEKSLRTEMHAGPPPKGQASPGLSFTVAESTWLAEHPRITIAVNQAWPPMDYVDSEGQPRGIGVGFIRALNERLDGRLKIVPLPWTEMYQGVKEGRLDALMDITPTKDREAFFY